MAIVHFAGAVSQQAGSGEIVTIRVTKPDATTQETTAPTALANGAYSANMDLPVGPGYSVKVSIGPDQTYKGAESQDVPFESGKDRTITVVVTN